MNEIVLSKESSASEIKRYFNAVLELSKSDNEFPINLDEVWMLVYSEKGKAVRALKENFIEGVDYNTFAKKGKTGTGGYKVIEYNLTISCMEFFIARKVRPVFEVYREVFHKVAQHELSRKELALMVIQAEEEKERLMLANEQQQATIDEQEKQLKSQAPKVQYVDNVLQSVNTYTSTQIAKEVGMDAAKFHKALKERKVMFYQSGTWMLTAKYQGQGYTKMRTHQYTRNDGSIGTNSYTVFTERGRALMHSIFAK